MGDIVTAQQIRVSTSIGGHGGQIIFKPGV